MPPRGVGFHASAIKVSLPNGVSVAADQLDPAPTGRAARSAAARRSSAAPVTSSSGLALRLRRSLVPSMTIAWVDAGLGEHVAVEAPEPAVAAQSCRMRLPPSPWFITAIGRPPRARRGAARAGRPAAERIMRRDVGVGQRVAERDDPARFLGAASTSTPQRKYHSSVSLPTGIAVSPVKSPGGEM